MNFSKYDPTDAEKKKDAFIAVYYIVILISMGVPMWYLTTSTYRASLPLREIEEFSKSKITITIKLNIICFEPISALEEMINFEDSLFHNLRQNHSFNDRFVTFKYMGYVRPASSKEWQAYHNKKTRAEVESLVTVDSSDAIYVLILPRDTTWIKVGENGLVRTKSKRSVVYLKMAPWEKMRLILESLLNSLLAQNAHLNHVYRAVTEVPPKEKLEQIPARLRTLYTRVRSSSSYHWSFSLVVPHPKGGPRPEWNFAHMSQQYLEPLQQQLAPFVQVNISSQLIYNVRLERLWPSRALPAPSSSKDRYYSKEDLTHVVNGLEAYLGGDSDGGNTHLVTYLASGPGQPALLLGDRSGILPQQPSLQAFTVPRWGALVLLNNVSVPLTCHRHLVAALLPQIKSLMGLSAAAGAARGTQVPLEEEEDGGGGLEGTVPHWRLQGWLRERTVENLALTQVTLHSLADLLDKVANMVIRDDVARDIRLSLSEALSLPEAQDLASAFLSSRRALQAAETAFFHPSLLELLYFQEDQKYGIYIPLFVPVLLPLFLAALKVRPYLRLFLYSCLHWRQPTKID